MATYVPKIVDNSLDLKCAQKLGETVIISTSKEFFVELDKKVSGSKIARKTKSVGKKGIILGGILTILTGGLGLVVLGASALGTVAGVAMDQFKDYKIMLDYDCKRVIFLKSKGSNAFDENKDTIDGIDLNAIILKNKRSV